MFGSDTSTYGVYIDPAPVIKGSYAAIRIIDGSL